MPKKVNMLFYSWKYQGQGLFAHFTIAFFLLVFQGDQAIVPA
jgi:hypothetical protein